MSMWPAPGQIWKVIQSIGLIGYEVNDRRAADHLLPHLLEWGEKIIIKDVDDPIFYDEPYRRVWVTDMKGTAMYISWTAFRWAARYCNVP